MAARNSTTTVQLLVFDIPTLIIADDPQLLAAACAAYAHWSAAMPFREPALELRIETGPASALEMSFEISVEGSRLRMEGPAIKGGADAVAGRAAVRLPASLAADPPALNDVLDTLLLFMLARRDRTPVHAAAFMLGDRAILLAGRSGSGKSTLALAAAVRGLPVLSDDTVFVQLEPAFAVWGFPRPIHVYPEDGPAGVHATRSRNQKLKKAIEAGVIALSAADAVLVVLARGAQFSLDAIDPEAAVASLMKLEAGFDLLALESRAALQALAGRGAWRLTLEEDPAAAVDFLVRHLPN